jgi:hypothetical protein
VDQYGDGLPLQLTELIRPNPGILIKSVACNRLEGWVRFKRLCVPICTLATPDEQAVQFKLTRFHFVKTYRALTGHAPIQDFIQLKWPTAAACSTKANSWGMRICMTSRGYFAKWWAWHPVITGRCISDEVEMGQELVAVFGPERDR